MVYLKLLLGFLKVGCFSFGGAYSAIPLVRDVVLQNAWMDDEQLSYMIAVSESTPGPIMVNLATYVGNTQGGIPGAVLATTAVIAPAFIIILLITVLLKSVLKNKYVVSVLDGLVPCITAIILATGCFMIIKNCVNLTGDFSFEWRSFALTVILALIYFFGGKIIKKKITPITLIIISAALGIALYSF